MIKKKDFIDVQDFTKEEYLELLEVIRVLKEADQKGIQVPLLKGMTIALMFDQPSTRTRVSFESAMDKLGGDALYLETKTMHVGEGRETMKDTALVISGMCDAIECRNENHDASASLRASGHLVPSRMPARCRVFQQLLCIIQRKRHKM